VYRIVLVTEQDSHSLSSRGDYIPQPNGSLLLRRRRLDCRLQHNRV